MYRNRFAALFSLLLAAFAIFFVFHPHRVLGQVAASGTYTLTVNQTGNGTTAVSPNQPTFTTGEQITVTATPDSGWRFAGWSANPDIFSNWWDNSWTYRYPVTVGAGGFTRTDKPVEVAVNFTHLMATLGDTGTFDPNSIRVIEVGVNKSILDTAVPFQFDPASSYDAATNANGTVTFLMPGATAQDATRYFHIYFDTTTAAHPPVTVTPRITLTDNVMDEGQSSYRIETPTGTYFYQKTAGGFSSWLDTDGNDWISYNTAPGAAGEFRGIPNMVFPEGHFHPGATNHTTVLESAGPLKAVFRSTTNDNLWETVWEVFPGYARMTVVDADHDYWFLYEGTPGGHLDMNDDLVVRPSGSVTPVSQSWTGDLAGDEWVYFVDPALNRSLFLANHEDDTAVDSYAPLNNAMTVFGFGRDGISPLLSTTPAQFTIGLTDQTDFDTTARTISDAYQPLVVTVSSAQNQTTAGVVLDNPLSLTLTDNQELTAQFVEDLPISVSINISGNGSVIKDPAQSTYEYGETVTLTASASLNHQFAGWGGSVGGSENPLVLTLTEDKTINATFQDISDEIPQIDIWYGDTQTFGNVGRPQEWANIMGNVSDPDGVTSLEYSLNGGTAVNLTIGPDGRRLGGVGDFNIDIDMDDLVVGANTVTITAIDSLDYEAVKTVTINYDNSNSWPEIYSIDWDNVTNIQDVAQVVDGKWAIQDGGLRAIEPDYDRLVAIGETSWDDYEVIVPFTLHSLDPDGFVPGAAGGGAAIGVLMRWSGHTDTPIFVSGKQPKSGWWPYGAIGWYWWENPSSSYLRIDVNDGSSDLVPVSEAYSSLSFETEYFIKMRVETNSGNNVSTYSLKMWPASAEEPIDWDLTTVDPNSDPDFGSLMLVAHHVDATFGDVLVTPLSTPAASLTVNTNGNGSVTLSPNKASYSYGEVVTLTAVPATNWSFTGWSGSRFATTNPITLTMDGPKVITANFYDDSLPPVISNVQVTPFINGALVQFDTNKLATSQVAYGTTNSYELGTAVDNTLTTTHSIFITGLDANTLHHFQITATDTLNGDTVHPDDTFTTLTETAAAGITSDDFNACGLSNIWTFINPLADGTAQLVNGTLHLTVPSGQAHDVWNTGNNAPRIMQTINNDDFQIEVKFESELTANTQMQGIIIQQDASNYLRFDFYHNGSTVNIFAASFSGGTPFAQSNVNLGTVSAPMSMRITRDGNNWTQSYSFDGRNWTTSADFDFNLAVSQAGVFAANTGGNPAHTAVIDYFFTTANPIVPEDGNPASTATLTLNSTGSGSVTKSPDQTTFNCGETVELTAVPANGWLFSGWSGDLSGTTNPVQVTMSADKTITAVFVDPANDDTPPVISNVQVTPYINAALITWETDEPATSSLAYGLTNSYGNSVDSADLKTEHIAVVEGLAANTLHHFQISVTDAAQNTAATTDDTFTTLPTTAAAGIDSDDFNNCLLNTAVWNFIDPLGGSSVTLSGTQAAIFVPSGSEHNVWSGGNMAPRIMQPVNDDDFELEVKFDSFMTKGYQMQGLIVEQDGNNFLRFDFYSDGINTYIFAAKFVSGTPDSLVNMSIPASNAPLYMRINRTGDDWEQSYSFDGQAWTTATSFTHALTVTQAGVFAGNTGSNPAHTAVIDYFFTTANPIIPEDGTAVTKSVTVNVTGNGTVQKSPNQAVHSCGEVVELTAVPAPGWQFSGWSGDLTGMANPAQVTVNSDKTITAIFTDPSNDTVPPIINNVQVSRYVDSLVVTWETNEPASSQVKYGLNTSYGLGTVTNGSLKTQHTAVLPNLNASTLHQFQIRVTDAASNSSTQTGNGTTLPASAAAGIVSDDFNSCTLDSSIWTFINPVGDSNVALNGTKARIDLPAGVTHDVWTTGNNAPRIMQSINDTDFEVEVKFDSMVSETFEMQGIIVEQDENTFLRFDFYGNEGKVYIYAAQFVNGLPPSTLVNQQILTSSGPLYMRIKRVGDTWTQSYSLDGKNWTVTSNSINFPITVDQIGVFAGNTGANPAHTAVVDYFFTTAAPILNEDADTLTCNGGGGNGGGGGTSESIKTFLPFLPSSAPIGFSEN